MNLRRRALLATVLTATTLAAAAVLAGCSAPQHGSSVPSIVVTTTQVGDFTRTLVGDRANVTQLLQPGQSAHTFDPSAAQLRAIGAASIIVVNGAGLDTWITSAVSASGFHGTMIDASTGITLHHAEDEHEDAQTSTEPAPSSSTDEVMDPHVWTDPTLAAHMVQTIADGLVRAGLDTNATRTAATTYINKLTNLDTWIQSNMAAIPAAQRLLVTNHDAFGYFVTRYDITLVGSVIPSFDDNTEPSAAQIDALVEDIKKTGVKAVFAETSIAPKTADAIANAASVKVYSGDDALYGDSLGAANSEGATYLGAEIHNARLVLTSWGHTATELPATLNG